MQSNILSNSNGHEAFVDGNKIDRPPQNVTSYRLTPLVIWSIMKGSEAT
jgi:hypothetical protein